MVEIFFSINLRHLNHPLRGTDGYLHQFNRKYHDFDLPFNQSVTNSVVHSATLIYAILRVYVQLKEDRAHEVTKTKFMLTSEMFYAGAKCVQSLHNKKRK